MASDAESVLREKLKVALQDARNLFDEGLVDEKEFKDLKAHELHKYKEQLAAITVTSVTHPADTASPETGHNSTVSTPVSTPLKASGRKDPWRSSANLTASPISPTSHVTKSYKKESNILLVDKDTYNRLTTPPIFRRRSRNKRKIVLPCAELKALQGLPEDKSSLN